MKTIIKTVGIVGLLTVPFIANATPKPTPPVNHGTGSASSMNSSLNPTKSLTFSFGSLNPSQLNDDMNDSSLGSLNSFNSLHSIQS